MIPLSWEKKLGELVYNQMIAAQKVIDTPEIIKQLNRLNEPLISSIDSPYKFNIVVIEESVPNAYALPGGYIVIHSGLINTAENPSEVLGVLAHEIAHVEKRHGLKNMVQAVGVVVTIQFLIGDIGAIAAVAVEKGAFLLQQKHSRDAEREADELAFDHLVKADINPEGLITFFKKLEAKEHDLGVGDMKGLVSLLETHPETKERIAYLEDKIKMLETLPDSLNFEFMLVLKTPPSISTSTGL